MLRQYYIYMLLAVTTPITVNGSIGCYVCSSVNGSDSNCEDEFDAHEDYYQEPCLAPWRNRDGRFPARWCYKLTAVKGNYTVVVRNCALHSGGMTKDVEIGTLDHCGLASMIEYNNVTMKGCLMTCGDDGCNKAPSVALSYQLYLLSALATFPILIGGNLY